tara:strand:+ start:19044 stop:19397 length:354 start_codon:yes stop_codon:yes gene_type:complete
MANATSIDENGVIKFTYNLNRNTEIFDSGDFVKDWYDYTKRKMQLDATEFQFVEHSSVSEFVNNNPYKMMYLTVGQNREWVLINSTSNYRWFDVRYYVEEDTNPTWEELKERCDNEN